MNHIFYFVTRNLLIAGLLLTLLSCTKEKEEVLQDKKPLNFFSMYLNDQLWQPSVKAKNPCRSTFHAASSSVTETSTITKTSYTKPIYTIWAYKDSEARADYRSENILRLQFADVKKPGIYTLTGSYSQDFSSYALLVVNTPEGTSTRYVNNQHKEPFIVDVQQMIPIEGTLYTGIEGSFYGTIYNEVNPLDSLTVERGIFSFRRINWYNFEQCAE